MPEKVPSPVQEVEKTVRDAAPAAVRPEVQAVEDLANAELEGAVAGAPAEHAKAAGRDPGADALATDVTNIYSGKTVSPSALVGDVGHVVKEVKAGYKTTEFWITVVVIFLSQIGALSLPGKYGQTITTAAAAAAYAISRGLAK